MMDISRNQVFLVGLVFLCLGGQFLMIDSLVLTPDFTQFLAERTNHPLASVNAATASITTSQEPIARKTVRPPQWLGWALASVGSVLVLHSMGMRKPE